MSIKGELQGLNITAAFIAMTGEPNDGNDERLPPGDAHDH